MKKIVALILLSLLISASRAGNGEKNNFVLYQGVTYYCDEVYIGPDNTRICSYGSESLRLPTAQIEAYYHNGKLFEKLPIITKNFDTAGWAFMQFIASYSGYRLYRYCSNCAHYDPATGEINPSLLYFRYYIFKGGKFFALTDDEDANARLALFGVRRLA